MNRLPSHSMDSYLGVPEFPEKSCQNKWNPHRDHCVWRAAGPAKQAAITLDLAVQPVHLPGSAAPHGLARRSRHSQRIKPLRIYDS